jgi:DNA repair protein RecO (recombination protein O)
MALGRSTAVVIGSFPLGESDRVVTFFAREFGKVRGVARAARRIRSRFTGALELLTLGELVFFDPGRGDLVRIDHFDVVHPFERVRADLGRLAEAAWIVECVGRLTADRDPNAAVYGQLVRALQAIEAGVPPRRVTVVFGVRCVEALGHRLRTDACAGCGRRVPAGRPRVAVDVEAGGAVCERCATPEALWLATPSVDALRRLRTLSWAEATAARLDRAEDELRRLLDVQVASLAGQPSRTARFVREIERFDRGLTPSRTGR